MDCRQAVIFNSRVLLDFSMRGWFAACGKGVDTGPTPQGLKPSRKVQNQCTGGSPYPSSGPTTGLRHSTVSASCWFRLGGLKTLSPRWELVTGNSFEENLSFGTTAGSQPPLRGDSESASQGVMFEDEFEEFDSYASSDGTARDGKGSGLRLFVVCGLGGFD